VVAILEAFLSSCPHETSRSIEPDCGAVPSRQNACTASAGTDTSPIIDADTIEGIEPAIRDFRTGRYDVDEISADSLPRGYASRRWGVVIKWLDGAVFLEADARDA
jgi:hypothetical protein